MDNASRHATFLADALLGCLGGDASETDAMNSYHQCRNEHAMESYRRTTTVATHLRQLARSRKSSVAPSTHTIGRLWLPE